VGRFSGSLILNRSMTSAASDARSDAELVDLARGGDMAAFETLVDRHERRIYGLARRLTSSVEDAQDVTQDAFVSALRNLSSLKDGKSFGPWLTSIAARLAIKTLRRRRDSRSVSLDDSRPEEGGSGDIQHLRHIADWRAAPDELARESDTRRHLDRAIAGLSPEYRAVFLLRDVEGLSVRETARLLGINEGNVKVRLLRARLALREKLTTVFGDQARQVTPVSHERSNG